MSPRSREGRSLWQGMQAGRLGLESLGQGETLAPLNTAVPSGGKTDVPRKVKVYLPKGWEPTGGTSCPRPRPSPGHLWLQSQTPTPHRDRAWSPSQTLQGRAKFVPFQPSEQGCVSSSTPNPRWGPISPPNLKPQGRSLFPPSGLQDRPISPQHPHLQPLGREGSFFPRCLTWEGGWHVQDLGHPLVCRCSSRVTGRP